MIEPDPRQLSTAILPLAFVVFIISGLYLKCRLFTPQLGPGPRGLPFLGNTLQVSTEHFATYLKGLHSRYGGFVYLKINNEHSFSIGDIELAIELLERRSAIYSSRPVTPLVERYADPEGFRMWTLAKPGEHHFWGRKLGLNAMKHVRTGHTEPLQRLEAVAAIQNIIETEGKHWYEEINRMVSSVTLAAMFGIDSIKSEAPELTRMFELVQTMFDIGHPFSSIINIFSFIDDLIPAVFPTPWRRKVEIFIKDDTEGWGDLSREALEGRGAQLSTWASMFIDEQGTDRQTLLGPFAAGALETSSTSLHSFVLACVAFPDWIETAQRELDSVVGNDRLPNFEDRPSLPFIEAIVREVIRWNPPIRIGGPHLNTADDTIQYQGKTYFIPKGSTIYCSPYIMEYDATRYKNPHTFCPQRFLDEKGQLKADYRTTSFGFGRRLCIGVPFAERTLWIGIATLLWTFNIRKALDPRTGLPFEYKTSDDAFNGGGSSGPHPFPVLFVPRDDNRVSVVRREWDDSEKEMSALLPPLRG